MIILHIVIIVIFMLVSVIGVRQKNVNRSLVYKGNPYLLLLGIYFFSAVSSLFVGPSVLPTFHFEQHSEFSYLLYTLSLIFLLLPILLFKGFKLSLRELKITSKFYWLYPLFSVLIFFSLIYQIPYAIQAMKFGAVDVRAGLNVDGEGIMPSSWLTTVAVVTSSFYVLFIFMFFFALKQGMRFYYKVSMFVGGLLYVVSSLAFTARDGALFWLFTMFFAFYLFKDSLKPQVVRKFKLSLAVGSLLMLVVISSFTLQRFFNDGDSTRLVAGTLGYIGQQPYVFAETIYMQNEFYGLSLRFPLLDRIMGGDESKVERFEVYEWTFGTLAKDFYAVDGYLSLVFFVLFISIGFILYFRKRVVNPLVYLLMMGFYFQLISSGVFYFRLGTRGGNLYIIMFLLLLILISVYLSKQRIERNSL